MDCKDNVVLILVVGVPLYFAYGNPFPFADSNYNFFDNLWRAVFPLMFIGLAWDRNMKK